MRDIDEDISFSWREDPRREARPTKVTDGQPDDPGRHVLTGEDHAQRGGEADDVPLGLAGGVLACYTRPRQLSEMRDSGSGAAPSQARLLRLREPPPRCERSADSDAMGG